MKKLLSSIFILAAFYSFASAQFNSGSKMVGASTSLDLGLTSQKYSGSPGATKYTTIDINPRAGYFVQNGWVIGGDLNYYLSRSKYEDNNPYTTTTFLFGPFGRYYYKAVGPIRPFGEVRFGGGTSATRFYTTTTGEKITTRYNTLYAGAGVGAAFFLAENFSLEALLGYEYDHQKYTDTDEKSDSHGIALSFGFAFYFNSLLQK